MPENLFPDRNYFAELTRPWKLATFAVGMAWLLYGALNYGISDWDVGISLLMSSLTYLCAPWSVRVILYSLRYRPKHWILWIGSALAVALFVIDSVYYLYHTVVGNQMLRRENFYASSALYFLAGSIWLYRGSIRDFAAAYNALGIMHTPRMDTLKKLSSTFLGCVAMLFFSLPKHGGFIVLFFLLFLIPHTLYSIFIMIKKKEERKIRLIQMASWYACIVIIIGTHYYMHLQTRNAANQIVKEILVYKEKENAFPVDLNLLGSGVKETAKKNRIAYFNKDNKVYLFYSATFIMFDTYFYDFEASSWRYQPD